MRKIELVRLAVRFAFAEKSIALVTEGLEPQPFHGAMAVLVNEHTASASEMIAAFAAENRLATIVATNTAGRLLSGDSFKLPHGYVLSLPVGAYYTWGGRLLEGTGVAEDVQPAPIPPPGLTSFKIQPANLAFWHRAPAVFADLRQKKYEIKQKKLLTPAVAPRYITPKRFSLSVVTGPRNSVTASELDL